MCITIIGCWRAGKSEDDEDNTEQHVIESEDWEDTWLPPAAKSDNTKTDEVTQEERTKPPQTSLSNSGNTLRPWYIYSFSAQVHNLVPQWYTL